MTFHKAQMVLVGSLVATLAGCAGVESDNEAWDDSELAEDTDALANSGGTAVVDWSDPAIVKMSSNDSGNCTAGSQNLGGGCTGTLIGTKTVLTAAHCGSFTRFKTCVSGSSAPVIGPGTAVRHAQYSTPPAGGSSLDYDVAILRLNNPIAVGSIPPRNFSTVAPAVGAALDVWGMGHNVEGSGTGVKRRGSSSIAALLPWKVEFSKSTGVGICDGDSGGPAFLGSGGAQVGVHSTTSGACNGTSGYSRSTRVDMHRDWLMEKSNFNAWPAAPFGTQTSKKLVRAGSSYCSYVERAGTGQTVKHGPCPSGNGSLWDMILATSGTKKSLFVLQNKLDNKCLERRADGTFATASCSHSATNQPVSIYKKSNGKYMMISRESDFCISGAYWTDKVLRSKTCSLSDSIVEFEFR